MACILQISGAILFESTLSMLGLGASNTTSLGSMLYWAIQWGSVRTGAWWAFVPPTLMLTLIVFSLLLLQSSLNEVFNPRLRRGRAARKKAVKEGTELETPVEADDAGPVGTTGILETPVSAGESR
jgi:peptide/nickel transport system permease protein